MQTMRPGDPAPLAPDRAFVVQLRQGSPVDAGHLQGRIEHVTSGKNTSFQSLDEVLAFMQSTLVANPEPCDED